MEAQRGIVVAIPGSDSTFISAAGAGLKSAYRAARGHNGASVEGGFAIFSVPGGLLAAHIGKKKVLLAGLAINTLAVAIPAFSSPPYVLLLACIFLLGVGTTLLQVAGNPIMRDVSPPGGYSRNLALAQGFKGIGSSTSALLPYVVGGIGLLAAMGWRGAFPIFFALMLVALFLVAMMDIEETRADAPPGIGSSLALLGDPAFALAVFGIFLYVGAEVCMGAFLKPLLAGLDLPDEKAAALGPTMFFSFITVGRLLGGVLKVNPHSFFRISAFLGLAGLFCIMSGSRPLALAGVVIAGLGFANVWPMLFSITVEKKPDASSELSGLMCMAISGGALVPLVMGGIADAGVAPTLTFSVPAACFLYLFVLSLNTGHPRAAT